MKTRLNSFIHHDRYKSPTAKEVIDIVEDLDYCKIYVNSDHLYGEEFREMLVKEVENRGYLYLGIFLVPFNPEYIVMIAHGRRYHE